VSRAPFFAKGGAVAFDLDRFTIAQDGVIGRALAELRRGRKESHWMWFVFPQLAGPGRSDMARRYAIASLGEARAYLDHPLLGERLRESIAALLAQPEREPAAIFGPVDALKLRSSLTLFEAAAAEPALFAEALDAFYRGVRDPETLRLLAAQR
jgi:uncharacterized protein (DUF1810 family)